MRAAVVSSFDQPPSVQDLPEPTASGSHEVVVDVVAVGLHPRVRSQADGSHYTSTSALPLVPGIDGVGRGPDGVVRYFVLPDTTLGSMAERTVVDLRRSIPLPEDVDAVAVAAAMNPVMSSWVALRRRIDFRHGQKVLVLGANGNAGRLAVQVAEHLGAGAVVGAGREADLREVGRDVDVVLDYVWGQPTADALRAIVPSRTDDQQTLTWVQVGSVAGLQSPIPSAALRATRLELVGSGQGSVATADIVAELSAIAAEIARGSFTIDAVNVPLERVTSAWADAATSRHRIVITCGGAA